MKEEEILSAVITEARDDERQRADDSMWQKLLEGKLEPAEEAALRERAKDDPEIALALEAYAPLGAGAEDRMVAAILGDVAEATASLESSAREAAAAPVRALPAPAAPRRAPGRVIALFATPLALAAGLALWVTTRPQVEDLPPYALAFETAAQQMRSSDAPASSTDVELQPTTKVELLLRPDDDPKAPIGMRALVVRGTDVRPWNPPTTISPKGVVHITGKAADLFPEPRGTWQVVVAVGRPESLPTYAELQNAAADAKTPAGGTVRYVRGTVRFIERTQ